MIDSTLLTCNPALMPNDPTVPNVITTLLGNQITFQNVGVGLPVHSHTDNNIHCTVVISGSISVVRGTDPAVTYNAGDIADFAAGVQHSITGLTPNTVIFNLMKSGIDASVISQQITALANQLATVQTSATNLQTNLTAMATANAATTATTSAT